MGVILSRTGSILPTTLHITLHITLQKALDVF